MTPDGFLRWVVACTFAAIMLGLTAGAIGVLAWMGGATASQAVGDWLIRWRLAGHHCNHCQEEKR